MSTTANALTFCTADEKVVIRHGVPEPFVARPLTMQPELPSFKYHPDPFATKVVVERQAACPACHQVTGLAYEGPYYSQADVADLCPWCIANGRAAECFDLEFVYKYDLEIVGDPSKTDELQKRTPGYFFGTQYEWPTHCGDYCALKRPVQWDDIAHIEAELGPDLDRLEVEDGADRQAKRDALSGTALWAYLFKCLHCGKHRLVGSYE